MRTHDTPYDLIMDELQTSRDDRFIFALRMIRVLRLVKIERQTSALSMVKNLLSKKKNELIVSILLVSGGVVLCASIMYYLETEQQPSNYCSCADCH